MPERIEEAQFRASSCSRGLSGRAIGHRGVVFPRRRGGCGEEPDTLIRFCRLHMSGYSREAEILGNGRKSSEPSTVGSRRSAAALGLFNPEKNPGIRNLAHISATPSFESVGGKARLHSLGIHL